MVGTTKLIHAEAITAGDLTSQGLAGPSLCAVHCRDAAETRAQRPGWRNNLNRRLLPRGQELVCSFDAVDRAMHWAGRLAETYTELPAWQDQGTQSNSLLDRRHGWVGTLFELLRTRPPRRLLTKPSHVAMFRRQGLCRGIRLSTWYAARWRRGYVK